MIEEMPETRRNGAAGSAGSFEDTENDWFDRPSSRPSAPPSIEKIRAAFRSSAPPAPAAPPIGDDLVDEWLDKRRS